MNSRQFDELVRLARLGANYARAGNAFMAFDCEATLRGWIQCASAGNDTETFMAAQRALTWVIATHDYHIGFEHPVTESEAKLMWGDDA